MSIYEKLATLTDEQLAALKAHAFDQHMSRANRDRVIRLIDSERDSRAFLRACKQ